MLGRKLVERVMAVAAVGTLLATAGCGAFFQCEGKSVCTTTTTTTTGDVVFVASQGGTNLYGYSLATDGTLTAVSGSPVTLSFNPTAITLTPDDSLMYLASATGIYSYAVSSAGVVSNVTQQGTTVGASASLAVAPNGKWLFALDSYVVGTQLYLREYAIGTGGALSTSTTTGATGVALTTTSGQTITPAQVAISSDGSYIAVALGGAGYQIYPFNETTGVISTGVQASAALSTVADQSVAFDSKDNVYVARTTSTSGTSGTTGVLVTTPSGTVLSGATPYLTGTAPRSLLFADNYSYLYAANRGDNTITSFTVDTSTTSPTVTVLGSDVSAPSAVQALAIDKTGNFVFSAGTNTTGLEVFSIGTSGALTAGKTATTALVSGYVPLMVAMK